MAETDLGELVLDILFLEFKHVREKNNNLGFRPGLTQTSLYSHRSRLET